MSIGYESALSLIIPTLIAIYPNNFIEEYKGFRDDVIYTVGTRLIPQSSWGNRYALNPIYPIHATQQDSDTNSGLQLPSLHEDFSLSMIFCLKYLSPPEIESWVESLVRIDSPWWQLATLRWWLAYSKFLTLAQEWPKNSNLRSYVDELPHATVLFQTSLISHILFKSLADFLPNQNRTVFHSALVKQLTFDIFQSWISNIKSNGRFYGEEMSIDELLTQTKRSK